MLSRKEIEERLAWRDDIGRPGYSENEGETLQTALQLAEWLDDSSPNCDERKGSYSCPTCEHYPCCSWLEGK